LPTGWRFFRQISGFVGLGVIAALCWGLLVAGERSMGTENASGLTALMHAMMRPQLTGTYLSAAAIMWIVMMVAMMAPAALLMMVIFRRMNRGPAPARDATLFATGYLSGWSLFAVVAAGLQWWLHSRGWIRGMSLSAGTELAAGLFIAAGAYQLSPWKESCLTRCQSPMGFLLENWRDGPLGALQMGVHHSLYCVGCCWLLMLLMFAGGAMSVATMGALCLFVLLERLVPPSRWLAWLPGVALLAWGAWLVTL
jgi:predicted metal-binding membrane protein